MLKDSYFRNATVLSIITTGMDHVMIYSPMFRKNVKWYYRHIRISHFWHTNWTHIRPNIQAFDACKAFKQLHMKLDKIDNDKVEYDLKAIVYLTTDTVWAEANNTALLGTTIQTDYNNIASIGNKVLCGSRYDTVGHSPILHLWRSWDICHSFNSHVSPVLTDGLWGVHCILMEIGSVKAGPRGTNSSRISNIPVDNGITSTF